MKMNLEKFRENNITVLKRYQEWLIQQTDNQIKDIDKAESIEEIVGIVIRLPSKEKFEEFMKENGTTGNLSTPGKTEEGTQH